ncbi:MAG TPA: protocatechuate 3,4-dioxygenase subunit alpha [Acidimicrobiales bacterium]|nr:protocatechuate 3,4-dioxygenase subunit alpha [Acidimicrobiales bacterium]
MSSLDQGTASSPPTTSSPSRGATPSQTAGPFVSLGTGWAATGRMVDEGTSGAIVVAGLVLDGAGMPVTDAMLEFWQAGPEGRFAPECPAPWTGFTRALTGPDGAYRLVTIKPGRFPAPGGQTQAPHVNVSIFARGLLQRLVTRIYFSDEPAANMADRVLAALRGGDGSGRHESLVAQLDGDLYRLDIRLQGERETVFFAPW